MAPLDPLTFGPEQRCFGCGPHNTRGWRLRFEREGDVVSTRYLPTAGEEGPPGVFHGGLQATLVDELAGWTIVGLLGRMGFTTSMRVRYMRPVRIGEEIVARGRILSHEGRAVTVRATLEQRGKAACQATISYRLATAESAARTLGEPLPAQWQQFLVDDTAADPGAAHATGRDSADVSRDVSRDDDG